MNNIIEYLDDFTISLGEYNNDKMNMLFWIQALVKKVKGKIYIINFSKENAKIFADECREKWDKSNFVSKSVFNQRVIVEDNITCSMDFVYKYAQSVRDEDYILLIGGERLLPYSESKKLINTEYKELTINASLMQDEDWNTFCLWLDKLYGDFQNKLQGIIVNIGVDENTKSIILSLLDQSKNMSIICSGTVSKNQSNYIINEFYEKITKCKYNEMIEFLEENKNEIDNKDYIAMLSRVYGNFGLSTKAIEVLEENYDSLSNENKKFLADFLYREGGKEDRCKSILNEIFEQDKFLKDLMPSILRVYENDSEEIKKKWIESALKVDPDNPKVIEHYGNWLSHIKKYEEASKVFRKLRKVLDNQYYEIVARMNDILCNPPENTLDIQRYILQAVQNYPELHNEAIFRLVNYFMEINRSEYITYSLLTNINYSYDEETMYKLLIIKLEILSDIVTASKALGKLKPYKKEEHAKKINVERIKCITNSIITIAKQQNGYLKWRRFIDNCQSQNGWDEVVYHELINCIEELSILDIENMINNSFINKVECCTENEKGYLGIKLLRRIKTGEFDEADIDSVIMGLLKEAELEHNEDIKLWGRYYASIIYSLRGNDQLANNYALTIFDYYNIVSNENKDICILLGVMAWANSQFRIGRKIEGIICVISCIKYTIKSKKSKEIYPVLEEGLNLVGRFFFDNFTIVENKDKEYVCNILQSLSLYNNNLKVLASFINNSLEEVENKLKDKISRYKDKDIEWAGDITNLVAIYVKNGQLSGAIELIKNNYNKIIELYNFRMDLRYKLVSSWAKLLFLGTAPSIETYKIAKELLEVAIKDIENKRNVYHKEERAIIGDESKEIYKMYIEITTLMATTEGLKIISTNEQLKILENNLIKISPRSIIEQKKYNTENKIDDGLKEKENEFLKLKEEYNILYRKNMGHSQELNKLGLKIDELQEYLKVNHPYYRSLPNVENFSFEKIKKSLKDKEIFFQYIKLNIMSIQILITSKDIIIIHQLLDSDKVENSITKLNDYFYKNNASREDASVKTDIEILSKYFGSILLDYCLNNEIDKVYVMQDLSIGTYNLNMCNINDMYLLDETKAVINILDYNIFDKNKDFQFNKCLNRIYGNINDSNLKLIYNFLQKNKNDNFLVHDNFEDEIGTVKNDIIDKSIDTILLYGHGTSDPNGNNFGGSLGIQGKRELIHVENIIKGQNYLKNIILISCRGGVPLNNNIESSTGSWAELFETFNGSIIMCKWDVNTESSIFIIERMLNHINNNKDLAEALTLAIRESKLDYQNPAYWAGIELWMN
ncbi:tetratricopeptide repeat protein [Clostridium botulinum]|uniref:tetratricopeptide repeat protein n=1 Tax=Clostridium botulinum TaxID=1491 RepID=UPI000A173704|nr:hypothetical protein [Clostridium botulinum]OSB09888.1 hypothetical protein B2H96_15770 [Clostridium botulinum]